MKIPDMAEQGTLVVGASDPSQSMYSPNGAPRGKPFVMDDGGRLARVYAKHAGQHGEKIVAPVVKEATVKKSGKRSLAPTKPPDVEEALEEPAPRAKLPVDVLVPRNQYTVRFSSPLGKINMDVLDVIKTTEENALVFVFKDEADITFTPNGGDIMELTYIEKLSKRQVTVNAFSPSIMFTNEVDGKTYMLMVIHNEDQG